MRFAGVGKILAFNYPWYLTAAALNLAALAGLCMGGMPGGSLGGQPGVGQAVAVAIAVAVGLADFWLLASLGVSWYVYDLSPLAQGAWLNGVELSRIRSVAICHAGQDEASAVVARKLPEVPVRVFDFHQPGRNGTPSLLRARAVQRARAVIRARTAAGADPGAERIGEYRLPMESGSLDLALLVFSAHEIRQSESRAVLFRELARAAGSSGRIVVVEHLRDTCNLLAYGPGAFHFLPRSAWFKTFEAAGLRVSREWACTPFVRVFELGFEPDSNSNFESDLKLPKAA